MPDAAASSLPDGAESAEGAARETGILVRAYRAFELLFSVHAKRHADNNVRAGVIAQLPRYALEILAFGGILAIVLYFLRTGQNVEKLVPVMALYAFAGYRLMPADEPATLVAFLCSDEASAINGAVVPIDFGITA